MRRRSRPAALAAALLLAGVGVTGCSIIRSVTHVVGSLEHNRATTDAFTGKLQSGPTTFEAVYATTGSSPATVVYAVQPPNGLAFRVTPTANSGSSGLDIVANPTGEYVCTPPASTAQRWSCTKLGKASVADYNNILGFYTPAHWVAFLHGLALAAGFAGDRVTSSTTTVNGFAMSCVDLAPPHQGTSILCTTAQNVLGYVKVAGDTTSFEITRYSTAPAGSLFQLPPGATVTTIPTSTTTTSGT